MRPKTLGFNLITEGENGQSHFPIIKFQINVNGGYTDWNRWTEHTTHQDLLFSGIDLCRSATVERDQAINRSIVPGTFISQLKGKQHG